MTRTEHVRSLAEELKTNIYYHRLDHNKGLSWPSDRFVYQWTGSNTKEFENVFNKKTAPRKERAILVPPPYRSISAYWVCMHELGHIACRHTPARYRKDTVGCEIEAWQWAIDNSLYDLSIYILRYEIWPSLSVYQKRHKSEKSRLESWYFNTLDRIRANTNT